jgi:hypothetical protein
MRYEEAKPFLKEGMKVKIISGACCYNTEGKTGIWNEQNNRLVELEGVGYGWCSLGPAAIIDILTESDGVTPWKDPRVKTEEPKFKVGDKLKKKTDGDVIELLENNRPGHWISIESVSGCSHWSENWLEENTVKLPDEPETKIDNPGIVISPEIIQQAVKAVRKYDFWSPSLVDWERYMLSNQYYYGLPIFTGEPKKEKTMNNVFQAIKAKLSPTDRTLVKHGYLNSDGSRTESYESQLKEQEIKELIEAQDTSTFRKELAEELREDEE